MTISINSLVTNRRVECVLFDIGLNQASGAITPTDSRLLHVFYPTAERRALSQLPQVYIPASQTDCM